MEELGEVGGHAARLYLYAELWWGEPPLGVGGQVMLRMLTHHSRVRLLSLRLLFVRIDITEQTRHGQTTRHTRGV